MKTENSSKKSEQNPEPGGNEPESLDVYADDIKEVETPGQESPAGQVDAPASNPPVPETLPAKKSFLYSLFSPETRLGRFMRPFLRWIAAVTGLFALGMLAAYFVLYQPVMQERDALHLKVANDALVRAKTEIALVKVMKDVADTRNALDRQDGPGVMVALNQLDKDLRIFLPMIKGTDPAMASLLQNRVDLVKAELSRDPVAARSDLEMLNNSLTELEKTLEK